MSALFFHLKHSEYDNNKKYSNKAKFHSSNLELAVRENSPEKVEPSAFQTQLWPAFLVSLAGLYLSFFCKM